MARRKRVTIRQVAQEAGVSTQTVSRVLNDRPDVAPGTRQHVQEVIDRLGYQPSHAARSLSQGQSCSIGVVAYGIEYFGPSRAVSGIEKQASELGYTPLLYLLRQPESADPAGPDNVARILADLLSHHVDGIIWAVPEIGGNRAWVERQIPQLPVPLVFLSMEPQPGLSVVCVDNYRGGRIATEHLLDQGYKDIGLVAGPLLWWEAKERVRGCLDALEEAGIAVEDNEVVSGTWSAASGQRGLNELLEQRPDVDAVFIGNDQMALGAFQAARERSLRVPDDLAIVGYDDVPEAAYFQPPLTTVSQPLFDVGCTSVKELHRLIEEGGREETEVQTKTILLQPELIIRQSSVGQ
jgi:LacI family transcriptional regulator